MITDQPRPRNKPLTSATIITASVSLLVISAGAFFVRASKQNLFNPAPLIYGNTTLTDKRTYQAVKTLKDGVDSFVMYVTVSPVERGHVDQNLGLHSLVLFTSPHKRAEPDAVWPNGQPVSTHVRITKVEAEKIIDTLARDGFFEGSEKYYSERVTTDQRKHPPPADSTGYRASERNDRHCSVRLVVNDEYWYTYYEGTLDWNTQTVNRIGALEKVLNDDGAKALRK